MNNFKNGVTLSKYLLKLAPDFSVFDYADYCVVSESGPTLFRKLSIINNAILLGELTAYRIMLRFSTEDSHFASGDLNNFTINNEEILYSKYLSGDDIIAIIISDTLVSQLRITNSTGKNITDIVGVVF